MKKTITSILTILILSNCTQQEISNNNLEEKTPVTTAGFSNIWDYNASGGLMIGNHHIDMSKGAVCEDSFFKKNLTLVINALILFFNSQSLMAVAARSEAAPSKL